MQKRILSLLLALFLIISLLPNVALAAETINISVGKEGLAAETFTNIISDSITANSKTVSTTYLIDAEADDTVTFTNGTSSSIRKQKIHFLSGQPSTTWQKDVTKQISDFNGIEVTADALKSAGFSENSFTQGCYTYYFIAIESTKTYGILVQVGKPQDAGSVEKDALNAEIAKVTGENAANWHQENDRYNGQAVSTNGFWADMQTVLTNAKSVAASAGSSQATVDAATQELQAAIDNLIPTSQINATGLYEAVQAYEKLKESDYTSGSWAVRSEAVAKAEAMLAELFDENGEATEDNKAEQQEKANALAEEASRSQVLVPKDAYDGLYATYQSRLQEARNLVEQYDPSRLTEADYTPGSWSAYETAWEDLRSDVNHTFSGGIWADYVMLGGFPGHIDDLTAARLQLASSGEVTISLTYVDNMRSRYPDMKEATAVYHGTMTLPSGSTTLSAALEKAGITYSTKDIVLPGGGNTSDTDPFLAIYFNGECVGTSYLSKLGSSSIQIPDGADVKIVRCAYPLETMEASTGYDSSAWYEQLADSSADYADSFALIDMTAPETAAVGEKVKITGSVTGASYSNLGQDLGGAGLTLFVSEASESETLSAPTKETVTVTGKDGTLEYVFTRPGWYTVALFDMTEDVLTATDIFGAITTGTYYSLRAGDFALIHVTEAADPSALLEQYRTEKAAEAKAFFEQYHDYDFTAEDYASFQSLYDTLQSNLASATDFTDLMEQYDTDYLALRNAAAKAMNHEAIIADLRANLAYLPSDLSTMDETYASLLTEIQTAYQGLNAHQKSLLTGNEIALLDQAAAISPDSLTKLARVTVTFYKPEENEYPFATIQGTFSGTGGSAYHNWPNWNWLSHQRPDGSIPDPSWSDTRQYAETMTAKAGDYVYVRLYLNHTDDQYWPMWSVDSEETWNLFEPATYGGVDGYYLATWQVPEDAAENSTYHIDLKMVSKTEYEGIVAEQDTEGLEEAKTSAKAALQATYNGYDLSKYDDAGKTQLKAALEDGLKAIDAATTTAAVTEARKAALAAMASVKTIDGGSSTGGEISFDSGKTVGKVHVIIENTTYADGPFYGEGSIADGWYDLGENDTMMTMALKVLQSNGYAWNGTTSGDMEAADYTITYISSITKDGQTLAEFTGGNKSGWMGTLNDWFVNEGFQAFGYKNGQLENNDEIHIMYTCDYGVDLHGDWNDHITTLEKMAITGGTLTPSFDGSVTDYTLVISDTRSNVTVYPVPVNKNYQHRIFLNDYNKDSAQYKRTETISVTSGDVIYVGVGEQGWPTMNSGGSPTKYTIRVYSLAEALANLASPSQVNSSNYAAYQETVEQMDALIKAQSYTGDTSKLEALRERVTFFSEIDEVKDLLNAIPDVGKLTTSDKSKVQAARTAYDKLSEEQRLYITLADVSKYNAAVEWLEKQGISTGGAITKDPDEEAASEVIALIEAIGTVTEDSGDKIAAARKAYDALTDAQKKLVTNYNVLTEAEAAFAALTNVLPFTDVAKDAWYFDAVQYVYENELFNGTGATSFSPNAQMNRAMLATVLYRLAGEPAVTGEGAAFTDVAQGTWYTDAVAWASGSGIVTGYGDGLFGSTDSITREQLAVMLYRYAQLMKLDTAVSKDLSAFTDAGTVSTWATDAMAWAYGEGLITGRTATTLVPQGTATRAEVATIFMRFAALAE